MRGWAPEPHSSSAEHDPESDARFMAEALALGRTNLGQTWPNPSVGAVVVKDGVVVGRGVTQAGGRPHAEAVAIAEAGLQAVGATLYVTLEPCSHRSVRGGTPCLEHTLLSGIRRVVSALEDPNPHIRGVSHALLRSAGIKVSVGTGHAQARRDNLGHIMRLQQQRPMVTLKLAQTSDGYCAPQGGGRLQVSGEEAMKQVHLLRAHHDAIMVGIGTALSDDPMLNVRLPGLEQRSPVRLVLDSQLRLPLDRKLVQTAHDIPLWVIASETASETREKALKAKGVEVLRVASSQDRKLDLAAVMRLLGLRGITRVFSEGGPSVAEQLVTQGLADIVMISTADHALGSSGVVALRPMFSTALADQTLYTLLGSERFGTDVFETYERLI